MGRIISALVLAAATVILIPAAPAVANPPEVSGPFTITFHDRNPCTDTSHRVTIRATFSVHEHDDRFVGRSVRTITTSDGYVGTGTSSFVTNAHVSVLRFTDMMSRAPGDRFAAQGVFVFDLRSSEILVDRFRLACLG